MMSQWWETKWKKYKMGKNIGWCPNDENSKEHMIKEPNEKGITWDSKMLSKWWETEGKND